MISRSSSRALGLARFFALLSLTIWIGGLTLIGIAAPAIFKINRVLGPRIIGAILETLGPVSLVCAIVLFAAWLWENALVKSSTRSVALRRSLRAQGFCSIIMLLFAAYLALVAEPRIRALQPPLQQTVLASENVAASDGTSSINPTKMTIQAGHYASPQDRAEFRKLHGIYGGLTTVIVLLGVINLALLAMRSMAPIEYSNQAET